MATLSARVANLEMRNRGMFGLLVLFIVGAITYAWFAMPSEHPSAATESKIEADTFMLRGRDGSPVALLSNAKGGPELFIVRERRSLQLQVAPDSTKLELRNGDATMRARLAVGDDNASMRLLDASGKIGADMSVTAAGSVLTLNDDKGKPRIRLAVTKDGPEIKLLDENGKATFSKP
jgi:hypothetical protein